MIEFKTPSTLVQFLENNLPPTIKEKLFYDYSPREYKGKTIIDKKLKKPFLIFSELKKLGFAVGITTNPDNLLFPEKYILLWTKFLKFIEQEESLNIDQKMYSLMSINEACKFLEVSRPTLYKIIKEGNIPTVKILTKIRIQLKDLLEYIDSNKK